MPPSPYPPIFDEPTLRQFGACKYPSPAPLGEPWFQGGNTNNDSPNMGFIPALDLGFITDNTRRMTIAAGGFVGIGIDSPFARLHVNQIAGGGLPLLITGNEPGNVSLVLINADGTSNGTSLTMGGSGPGTTWQIITNGTIGFQRFSILDDASGNEAMVIDDSLRVIFGGATPTVSAALEVSSTAGGFLMPRMTTVQRDVIAGIVPAVLLWNTTTTQFEFWNGAAWIGLGASGGWLQGGNTLGAPLVGGTNDNFATVLRSNGVNQFGLVPGVAANSGPRCLPVGVGANQGGRLLMAELGNASATGFRAPDSLAADVVYELPGADGNAFDGLITNGVGVLFWQPPVKVRWAAGASLTSKAQQFLQQFSATTSTTANVGVLAGAPGTVRRLVVSFVGDAANVAGETIEFFLYVNGVLVPGATIVGLAANAGTHTGSVDFTAFAVGELDVLTFTLEPSAVLTAAITNVRGAVK